MTQYLYSVYGSPLPIDKQKIRNVGYVAANRDGTASHPLALQYWLTDFLTFSCHWCLIKDFPNNVSSPHLIPNCIKSHNFNILGTLENYLRFEKPVNYNKGTAIWPLQPLDRQIKPTELWALIQNYYTSRFRRWRQWFRCWRQRFRRRWCRFRPEELRWWRRFPPVPHPQRWSPRIWLWQLQLPNWIQILGPS